MSQQSPDGQSHRPAVSSLLTIAKPSRVAFARAKSAPNMLREDADNRALDERSIIENIGGDTLDLGALTRKQRLPSGICRALASSKFIQRSGADLAFDRFAFVQHRKSEHHPGVVVTHHLVRVSGITFPVSNKIKNALLCEVCRDARRGAIMVIGQQKSPGRCRGF
jgi:hypothetical protein